MARLSASQFERNEYKVEGAWCLLLGQDEWSKQEAATAAVKQLLPADNPDAAPLELDGEGLTAAAVVRSAQTPALFGGACVTVVRGIQRMAADEQEALARSLGRAVPGAAVFLIASGAPEGERGHGVRGDLLKKIEAVGTVVEFKPPTKDQAVKWATNRARGMGSDIEPAAAGYLVEVVGENLLELDRELEKLSLFAAGEKHITRAHVREIVPRRIEQAVFEMAEAAADGKPALALQLVDDIFSTSQRSEHRGTAIWLLVLLSRQLRLVWDAKRLVEAGWKPGEQVTEDQQALLAQATSWFWEPRGKWKAERLVRQAHRFTWPALAGALDMLAETDLALKEGSTDGERLALEQLVVRLCSPQSR